MLPPNVEQLITNAPIIIFLWQSDNGIIYVNPAVTTILGYKQEDLYKDPDLFRSIVDPTQLDDITATLQYLNNASVNTTQTLTLRCRHQSGEKVWLTANVARSEILPTDEPTLIGFAHRTLSSHILIDVALQSVDHLAQRLVKCNNLVQLGNLVANYLTQNPKYELAIFYLLKKEQRYLFPLALSWRDSSPEEVAKLQSSLENQVFSIEQIPSGISDQSQPLRLKHIPFPYKDLQIKSMLFVPLKDDQNKFGLIGVMSKQVNVFDIADKRFIDTVAKIITITIRKIYLLQQNTQEKIVAKTLRQMSSVLVSNLDLNQTLTLILDSLAHLIKFDSAAIYLLSPDEVLKIVMAKGFPYREITISASKEIDRLPLDEAVIEGKAPVAITDVRQDIRWTPIKGTEYIRSWLGVPLIFRGNPIGIVTIDRAIIKPFTAEQIALAELLASQAAIAVENARLFSEVDTQRKQVRKLSNRVVQTQEEERRRISRELHDEMGQSLTGIKLTLQMLRSNLPTEDETLQTQLDSVIDLTSASLQEVRRLAMDLRPSILDDLGLVPTLRWYQNQFHKRSHTRLALSISQKLPRFSADTETALYRVVQEALTNVSRHANADSVEIGLSVDDELVYCSIIDDGQGFLIEDDVEVEAKGVGLTSMFERIDALTGQITVESQPGGGTAIFITIPTDIALNRR